VTAVIPDVLADPVGVVVALVAAAEPALSRTAVEDLVISVAAGRAKRRKLAGALAERPAVLSDGRSPAPRVIGDLLIALRKAGATVISPPVCAKCGKDLATLQRRGQDWYCGVCGPRRERCGACGSTRPVTFRARDGQPRCGQCPPGDGRDPAAVIAGIVAAIDPAVPAEAVVSAVQAAAAVSRLTTGHIQASGDNVSIRLGREPVALPEPLNALALQLVAVRHGHAAIGGQETSPWLFPAASPAGPSAPASSPNGSASSASSPGSPVPPRCSSSPPTCPPRCSPGCSASTSPSPSHGSAPRPETGWPTQPTSAAAAPVRPSTQQTPRRPQPEGHSDSC